MMKIDSTPFIEMNEVCDYIPGVSMVTNLANLFLKCVVQCLPKEVVANNRYFSYIKEKDTLRCVLMVTVPIISNIYAITVDFFKYLDQKAECDFAKSQFLQIQQAQAASLQLTAQISSGQLPPLESMMPVKSKEQRQLWAACYSENIDSLKTLLQKGVSPNFFHAGQTPLVTACGHSSPEIAKLLIDYGADVNTRNCFGASPMEAACLSGSLDIVTKILPHDNDINAKNFQGGTPLMHASLGGHKEIVECLLNHGADATIKGKDGSDAASNAVSKDHAELLPLLLGDDFDYTAPNYQHGAINKMTLLSYAASVNAPKSALYLLEKTGVHYLDSANNTVLFYASKYHELVQAILHQCSDLHYINFKNIDDSTALHKATTSSSQTPAALLLLQYGADPFIENSRGETPFSIACKNGINQVITYVWNNYHHKLTGQMKFEANQAYLQQPLFKAAAPDFGSIFKSALEGIKLGNELLLSIHDLPRTGMEVIFGRLSYHPELD